MTVAGHTLAGIFPEATHAQWLALVEGVLKGEAFEKALIARTRDGIPIEPLYPKGTGGIVAGAHPGRWRIAQRVDHPEPEVANTLALADLEGGADALALVLSGAPAARGFGLEAAGLDALDRALQGVLLDLVSLRVETAPFAGRQVAGLVASLAERRGHNPGTLAIEFGLDPVGDLARTGALPLAWPELAARAAATVADLLARGFRGPFLRIDTRAYHEAGASEGQELAAALATGVAYLRLLESGGLPLAEARSALSFLLVADADEFLTIAKLRALRQLWAAVEQACGLQPAPIALHAETAWRMTTRRDPATNILRASLACFSAGIGGADGVTVLPFTAALGLPDGFARRLARNTQIVLLDEANLARVADPAAGAGGFEALTEALCRTAWALFQEIEAEGGIVASLTEGKLAQRIAKARSERAGDIARRSQPITGTSTFPELAEPSSDVLAAAPLSPHASAGALPSLRDAEPFEHLRDLSDSRLAAEGRRPQIFLANLGPVSAFTARASFAKSFFEAGGIEALGNDGFPGLAEMTAAAAASDTPLACLCSSDAVYAELAVEAAERLKAAGFKQVYLAGRPGALEEPLRAAGVLQHIHAGCDALAILQEAARKR